MVKMIVRTYNYNHETGELPIVFDPNTMMGWSIIKISGISSISGGVNANQSLNVPSASLKHVALRQVHHSKDELLSGFNSEKYESQLGWLFPIYIYTCIYIYISVYMYIYIYTHTSAPKWWGSSFKSQEDQPSSLVPGASAESLASAWFPGPLPCSPTLRKVLNDPGRKWVV